MRAYSHSLLKTFRNCPRQFKFKYIDRVEVPRKLTDVTHLGNVVHRVLVRLYKLGSDGIVMSLEDVDDYFRQQWESVAPEQIVVNNDAYTVDDQARLGRQMLKRHYERFQPFNPGTLLGTELPLSFALPGTDFKFNVRIDRLWKRDDKVVEICDYKTGGRLVRPTDQDFFFQMGLYQLAVKQNYPQFETIELAQYLLRPDEIVCYRMPPDELERLIEELRLGVIEIKQSRQLDEFPVKEGPLCNYCDYVGVCPARRHKQLLAETTDGDEADVTKRAYKVASEFLDADRRYKELKSRWEELKSELVQLSKDMDLATFEGDGGQVAVRISRSEEFVTRTDDRDLFAQLSYLVREWGLQEESLQDFFELNARALMKEVYRKERLDPDQMEQLKRFVVEKERPSVRAKPDRDPGTDTE